MNAPIRNSEISYEFQNPYDPHEKIKTRELVSIHTFDPDEVSEEIASKFTLMARFGQRVSCGLFGISDDFIERYQSLDARFIKNKASTFFFEATSNSMEPLIFDGDVLIVDRSIECASGKIAVLCLEGEMICKRVIKTPAGLILRSENPAYKDLKLEQGRELTVFGVVTAIARELA